MSFDSYEDSVVDSVHNPTGHYTETDEFGNDTGSGYSSPDSGGLYQNHTPSPAWNPAWPKGVNPAFHNEPFIQEQASKGWSRQNLNAMGEVIFQNRAKAQNLAPHEQSIQNQIDVKPISFNQMPQSIRNNISGLINPTGQQIAAMNAQAAAGQQVAHLGWDGKPTVSPNKFHDDMDHLFQKMGWQTKGAALPPKEKTPNGLKKFVDGTASDVGNWLGEKFNEYTKTVEQDQKEPSIGNTLKTPTQPTENTYVTPANIAKYNDIMKQDKARGTDTLYNQGPQGAGGTSFSEERWKDIAKAAQVQSSTNNGLMDSLTQAYNVTPNMANATQVANSGQMATDALTYEDRQAMSKKQIVELINNRGTTSTIHAKSYEPYGEPGVVTMFGIPMGEEQDSYKPIYSPKDENLINLFRMKGFDAEDFRVYPQQQQNIKGGGQTSLGLPGSFKDEPLLSVTPGIDLMGAGIVGLGSALAKFGTKSVGEFVSKFGKDSFDMLKGMLSKSNETNLNKLANSPINHSDDILTVTEQGLMKPAMSNKFGLGTHTPKELGTINRNAPIQGENIYTNSKILGNRNRLNAKSIPVRARK